MAKKTRKYGKDFKNLSISLDPEDHKRFRIKAVEFEVSVTEVCRLALNDDRMWRRAQREKKKRARR